MIEEWRVVVGWEDYEVSNLGQVRSKKKGPVPRILKPVNVNGYRTVTLMGSTRKGRKIHTLVAEAFIGPRPVGHEIAHWDGERSNNVLSNLRYATREGNQADNVRLGKILRGVKVTSAKLSEQEVLQIRYMHGTQEDIGKKFGVVQSVVSAIKRRAIWKHLP